MVRAAGRRRTIGHDVALDLGVHGRRCQRAKASPLLAEIGLPCHVREIVNYPCHDL